MSGLKSTFKRATNLGLGRGYMTNEERREKKRGKITAAKNKMFASAQLPDEEEIRRVERRKSAKRRGSRAKTVMTERESLG
jgi:TnpA family transposase